MAHFMNVRITLFVAFIAFVASLSPSRAAEPLRITEFMAANNGFLLDEDGDSSDWVEIHNSGAAAVDLNGWHLTDDPGDLARWKFPATNIAAIAYLIVFASEKDRRTPGAPLHTDFKLDSSGGFLALVKPDGITVVSAYGAAGTNYPLQVGGVSYGIPVQQTVTTLLASGSVARVLFPT